LGGAGVFGGAAGFVAAAGFAGLAAGGLAAGGGAVLLLVSGWMPLAMETPRIIPPENSSGSYQYFSGLIHNIGDAGPRKLEMPARVSPKPVVGG
jgi:hypothetical protein